MLQDPTMSLIDPSYNRNEGAQEESHASEHDIKKDSEDTVEREELCMKLSQYCAAKEAAVKFQVTMNFK